MRTLRAVALFAAYAAFTVAFAPGAPAVAADVAIGTTTVQKTVSQDASHPAADQELASLEATPAPPRVAAPVLRRPDGGLADGARIPTDLGLDVTDIPGGKKALLCLALNDYFEARGETLQGRVAVAKVVLNRTQDLRFPNTVCGVVFESHRMSATNERVCQFSWHCDGLKDRPADSDVWRDSVLIAAAVLFGGDAIEDPTGGAMWYHTTAVNPPWATQLHAAAEIGAHLFYLDPNGGRPTDEQVASLVQNLPSVEEQNRD
jgi:hypothetical protein